jgi:hypothetical protein
MGRLHPVQVPEGVRDGIDDPQRTGRTDAQHDDPSQIDEGADKRHHAGSLARVLDTHQEKKRPTKGRSEPTHENAGRRFEIHDYSPIPSRRQKDRIRQILRIAHRRPSETWQPKRDHTNCHQV